MTKRWPGTSSLNLYGPAPMGYLRSAVSAPYFSYMARFVMMSRSKMYSGSGAVGCLVVKRTVYLSIADAEAMGAMFCPCLLCGSLRTRLKECTTSSAVDGEPSDVFAQMEDPVVRVFHLPFFRQHADVFGLVEIVGAEAAHDLAPDAVEQRDAVAVGIVGLHRLGNADRNARLRAYDHRFCRAAPK